MKYIKYLWILFISRLVGIISIVWYWIIKDYRGKARNIVYNYNLNNKKGMWQLADYVWGEEYGGWLSKRGNIKYVKVNYLQYLWWKWLVWIWLDDTCENDTFNIVNINSKSWYITNKSFFGKILLRNTLSYKIAGTAFELGDKRIDNPADSVVNEIHHLYTSDSNFDHMYMYTSDRNDIFIHTFAGRYFGWLHHSVVDDEDIFQLVFNKKIY